MDDGGQKLHRKRIHKEINVEEAQLQLSMKDKYINPINLFPALFWVLEMC